MTKGRRQAFLFFIVLIFLQFLNLDCTHRPSLAAEYLLASATTSIGAYFLLITAVRNAVYRTAAGGLLAAILTTLAFLVQPDARVTAIWNMAALAFTGILVALAPPRR